MRMIATGSIRIGRLPASWVSESRSRVARAHHRRAGCRILAGEVQPGDTVDPELLGSEFGVSRTVVREALRALAAKGMIEPGPTGALLSGPGAPGTFSTRTCCGGSPKATTSLNCSGAWLEVRAIIEPSAARLAAMRRSKAQLEAVEDALEAMAAGNDRPDLFTEADLAFHAGILRAVGNELLEQMESVIAVALSIRDRFVHSRRGWLGSISVHRDLFEAIADRTPMLR